VGPSKREKPVTSKNENKPTGRIDADRPRERNRRARKKTKKRNKTSRTFHRRTKKKKKGESFYPRK